MKKVLSVVMASAMVLGMGANAFAIQYNTGSNEKADWPDNFKFDGSLFVTDKNGDIITKATTAINDNEAVDFQSGDVIWMPLYADNQDVYNNEYNPSTKGENAVNNVRLISQIQATAGAAVYKDGSQYKVQASGALHNGGVLAANEYAVATGILSSGAGSGKEGFQIWTVTGIPVASQATLPDGFKHRYMDLVANSEKYFIATQQYTKDNFAQYIAEYAQNGGAVTNDAYVTVDLKAVKGTDDAVGKPHIKENVAYGHYTGNIDKNWSINLIEKSTGVADLVEKAELYKATANDYASYSKYTTEIMPNAVYLKITLKKEWKTVSNETLKYYVYVANNKNNKKTNEVWVSGKYAPTYRTVDFTWTNNANEAGLWKAEDNGVAVFDFADKAFFTVKMYKGETMYLDLSTAYDKAVAGEMDVEADSFYKFDKANASFSRTGELIIVSDDDSLVPYEIDEDGNFVAVDADYVKNYAIAHTNSKVNGFVFKTNQLGNYVLATEELGTEEDTEPAEKEEIVAPEVEEKPATETAKPNPNTGAEDFVGLAVSLAVVSVAAAGALALKQ